MQLNCLPEFYFLNTTPLHLAARFAHADVAKLLIERGAIADSEDHMGRTPLHEAKCADVVRLLLLQGAELEKVDAKGRTPLHASASVWNKGEVAKALLDAGAEPNKKDNDGETPLQIAERWDKCSIHNKNVVKVLQAAEAEKVDAKERTPLHTSALECEEDVAKALLASGP